MNEVIYVTQSLQSSLGVYSYHINYYHQRMNNHNLTITWLSKGISETQTNDHLNSFYWKIQRLFFFPHNSFLRLGRHLWLITENPDMFSTGGGSKVHQLTLKAGERMSEIHSWILIGLPCPAFSSNFMKHLYLNRDCAWQILVQHTI